ncbi:MAG: RNA pyrophosphohydrolase [Helicobacteraceae bacterium]|nr:RNA pyrophosphohydrolase [Helicobacteraceae bacterium]
MSEDKLYRPNVAAIILSNEYPQKKEIFLAERSDMSNIWQFPQGGIDEGESAEEALFRELEEEIGTDKVKIVAEFPEWISYDFPQGVAKRMKPYAGQKQRYYLVKLKKKAIINLETKHPEFISHKFVSVDELFDHVAHFKKPVYEKVVKYFKSEGFL